MFADFIWYPHQASTTARAVDHLFLFVLVVTGAVGLLVAGLLITFAVVYRRRPGAPAPGPMPGNTPLEVFWTVSPLIFFLIFFGWGAVVYLDTFRAPDDARVVYVVGRQWMWKVQHPEGQREINELHVPTGTPVKLLMTSEDVIHSFFVPDFRVHMDVLPGRYTSVWFHPTRPGAYHLFCSQYCGTDHSGMVGRVVVQTPEEFQAWLELHAEGSLALEGRKVFQKYRCISCHSGDAQARAPVLENLYGRKVVLRDGRSVVADETYIRESILQPAAKVVAGYEPIMPTFQGQVSEEEIIQLIAWMKSGPSSVTPKRVESSSPPQNTPPINPQR